jgi:hypothetical protein
MDRMTDAKQVQNPGLGRGQGSHSKSGFYSCQFVSIRGLDLLSINSPCPRLYT